MLAWKCFRLLTNSFFSLILNHLVLLFSLTIEKYYIRSKYYPRPSVSGNISGDSKGGPGGAMDVYLVLCVFIKDLCWLRVTSFTILLASNKCNHKLQTWEFPAMSNPLNKETVIGWSFKSAAIPHVIIILSEFWRRVRHKCQNSWWQLYGVIWAEYG